MHFLSSALRISIRMTMLGHPKAWWRQFSSLSLLEIDFIDILTNMKLPIYETTYFTSHCKLFCVVKY